MSRDSISTLFNQSLQKLSNDFIDDKCIPEILYHYTKFATLPKLLRNRSIRLHDAGNLDDEREIEFAHTKTLKYIQNHINEIENKNLWENFLYNFEKIDIFKFLGNTPSRCLSYFFNKLKLIYP